jgi:phenylalanyl-tRNA synthetase beta chain
MKFTFSWLKMHLDTSAPIEAIADKLTMIGLEVERIEDKAKELAPFTVARVLSVEKHPNADKLKVCMVETGDGPPVQVVCGAPNARAGMMGVFARPGAHIPGTGLDLKVGKIRGVESHGMLVSGREMGISEDHEGIIELPADALLGQPFAALLGLDDPVLDVAIPTSRPDCNGVDGIARDLAAAGVGTFKTKAPTPIPGKFPCPVQVKLDFGSTPSLCPAFALRLIRGVKNVPSPDWAQHKLRAIGLRPINALVDITNLITYDRCRPLHVFDAAKVKGNLTVRRAENGESLLALDGRTYALDDSMCVIADEQGVESLSGIMGGEATGCSEATTDVLVESALWEPLNIAHTGRKLGINSDARARFERGIDPAFTVPGLEMATKLILEICGGEPSEIVLAGAIPDTTRTIKFPLSEVERLAGLQVTAEESNRILVSLGFGLSPTGNLIEVTPPSWRGDIEGKADLVEEIVRIYGVDRVPSVEFDRGPDARRPVLTTIQKRTRAAKRALAARGLVEAVTWSFVSHAQAERFGGGQPELALANPIAADLSDMRPSLIPGLALAAQKNADRGFADVALFEVGQIFAGDRPEDQFTAACALRRGTAKPGGAGRHWSGAAGAVDAFDTKGDALAVLAAVGAPVDKLQVVAGGPAYLHPGRSGTIRLGPKTVLAHFGELHPSALEALDIEGPIAVAEVILERVPEPKARPTRIKPKLELSPFQPVERDFAFIVDRTVAAADLVRAAEGAERTLISAIEVFDVYEGEGIGAGKKSIAIAVTIQPRDKTLTDAEIDAVAARIVAEVTKRTGASLRG